MPCNNTIHNRKEQPHGILSEEERNAVTENLVINGYKGQKFTSLQGIDFFPNLQLLVCAGNQLTELDVSQTAVTTLCAAGNQIDINVEASAPLT